MVLSMTNLLGAIPGQRPAQPFFERVLGIVAEIVARPSSVGLRIAHVAFARCGVDRLYRDTFDLLEQAPNMIQRIAAAISCVVHFSSNALRSRGPQTQSGYIFDV